MTEANDTISIDVQTADLEMIFTITYTLTDDAYKQVAPAVVVNRPGPDPQLSDSAAKRLKPFEKS